MTCPFYHPRLGRCIYIPPQAYVKHPEEVARIASGGRLSSIDELVKEMCDGPGFAECRIYRLVKACALLQEIQRRLST